MKIRKLVALAAMAALASTSAFADYTNVDGNRIHSPEYAKSGPPGGATAKCRDGEYSFSQHRSGTCSGHHGVAEWLDQGAPRSDKRTPSRRYTPEMRP